LVFCHVRCIFPLHVNIVLYCTFYFLFRLVCLSKHSYLQWVISLIKVYANRYVHILSTETKEITLWHIRKTVKLKAPPCCQAFQTALYNVLNETPVGFCHRMLRWMQALVTCAHLLSPEMKEITLAHTVTAAKLKTLPRRRAFRTDLEEIWTMRSPLHLVIGRLVREEAINGSSFYARPP
jgi:hypothetical protein